MKRSEAKFLVTKTFGTQDPLNLVIDTDPGVDDAVAIMTAGLEKEFNLLAMTSIGGNVPPEATQKNARAIAALIGRSDIPVFAGCDRPLYKRNVLLADHIHGEDGLHGLKYPALAPAPLLMSASDYLIEETLRRPRGSINIAAIGPLTNISAATKIDPTLPLRLGRITIMGGAFREDDDNPMGNITKYAEFNTHCDPHAASIVYNMFNDIITIPMNITNQTRHDKLLSEWLRAAGDKGTNIANMMDAYAESSLKQDGFSAFHDFNVIAAIKQPDIYTYERGRVKVTTSGEREGETTFIPDPKGNVLVAVSVDLARHRALLRDMLAPCVSLAA